MKLKKLIPIALSAMCVSLIGAVTAFADETDEIFETETYETESYETEVYEIPDYEADIVESYNDDIEQANGTSLGDLNGDGKIDASDASMILEYFSLVSTGQPVYWSEIQLWAGDVNGDSIVDSSDASFVLGYYSYVSTLPKDYAPMEIWEYVENPPVTTIPVTTTVTTTTETTTTTVTTTVNYCRAPEGLNPGKKGTIEYIINTAELTERDCVRFYNIKWDNGNDGAPIETNMTDYLTDDKIEVLNNFAKEHFTDDMTNYDRLKFTWDWLHFNVQYANGQNGRPDYTEIWALSYAEACFVRQAGQCLQYNGAFAEMMAYMGYDAYMLEMYTSGQHFRSEVSINGVSYGIEVGDTGSDNPATGYHWMWLFDPNKAHLSSRP